MEEKKPHIKLSEISKKDHFPAPAGYFDTLQEKIDARIASENREKVIHVNWRYIGYAAAASVTLLVAVLVGIRNPTPQAQTVEEMIAAIPYEECIAYLEASDIEIDEIVRGTPVDAWDEPLVLPTASDSLIGDDDLDVLYERYGVTADENLQTL